MDSTPEAPALVAHGGRLGYRELDERANRLARHLRRLGVGPDAVVGLSTDRSVDLVVGLLGILKAGGAYLPWTRPFRIDASRRSSARPGPAWW